MATSLPAFPRNEATRDIGAFLKIRTGHLARLFSLSVYRQKTAMMHAWSVGQNPLESSSLPPPTTCREKRKQPSQAGLVKTLPACFNSLSLFCFESDLHINDIPGYVTQQQEGIGRSRF